MKSFILINPKSILTIRLMYAGDTLSCSPEADAALPIDRQPLISIPKNFAVVMGVYAKAVQTVRYYFQLN